MSQAHQNEMRKFSVLLSTVICSATLISACQKTPEPEAASETAPVAISDKPTGLVKTAVRQVDQNKDVGKYLDQFSAKTAAQIAQEEKQAKEAKLALEAKLAAEAKAKESKNASNAKPIAVAPVVVAKAPEVTASAVVLAATPAKPLATPATIPVPTPVVAEVTTLKLLSSVQPGFPRNAIRANVTEGVVNARIHISTEGKVTQVEILRAKPAKHFDQEVISAAMQWKYAPISSPQTKLLEFAFNREN